MSEKRTTLAILTHWTDDFWRRRFLVQLMIPRWETMGVRVVVLTDQDPFVPADVALLHADLSVVPETCRRLAERYPRVLNGAAIDTRKRRFSQLLVNQDGPNPGRVIIKTDCNCGGGQELRRHILEQPLGRWIRRLRLERFFFRELLRLEAHRSWQRRRMLGRKGYRVFEDRDQAPPGVWKNPNLIVERFLAEREGEQYYCRHWIFFGAQEVTRRSRSRQPIVKFDGVIERTRDSVPAELRAIRQQLGFDYGKFDYGIVNGRVVLYDVNRTPGAVADARAHAETVECLSEGLRAFLPR
jgi:hypothetical protein